MSLSYADDVALCELVGQNPCLYDLTASHYKENNVREKVWSEIAAHIGKRVDVCKRRWKNIRDTYNRHRKTPAAVFKASRWSLFEKLSYLEVTHHEKKNASNVQPNSSEYDEIKGSGEDFPFSSGVVGLENDSPAEVSIKVEQDDECQQNSPETHHAPKRRKIREENSADAPESTDGERGELSKTVGKSSSVEEDAIDVFFRSMAMAVKKLPPLLIAEAKKKVCVIITDLELRALESVSSETLSSNNST